MRVPATPRTTAGKTLLGRLLRFWRPTPDESLAGILAIEAESGDALLAALRKVYEEKWPKVGRIPKVPVTIFGGYADDLFAALPADNLLRDQQQLIADLTWALARHENALLFGTLESPHEIAETLVADIVKARAALPAEPRPDGDVAPDCDHIGPKIASMAPEFPGLWACLACGHPFAPVNDALLAVEKYLIEANAWQRGALERLRSDVHAYMEQANVYGGGLKIDRDDFDTILDDALVELDRLAASGEGTE